MDVLILRLIHIGAGLLWVGAAFTNAFFLQPTAMALGPDASRFQFPERATLNELRAELFAAGRVVVVGAGIAVVAMATARYWAVVL